MVSKGLGGRDLTPSPEYISLNLGVFSADPQSPEFLKKSVEGECASGCGNKYPQAEGTVEN